MATKKLSKSEIKKKKCTYPDPPDEGLPIWMGTFADMMTLLFAFFVLLFSMSTLDPVKFAAFQNVQAENTGGTDSETSTGIKSQVEIKQDLQDLEQELKEDIIAEQKEKIKKSSSGDVAKQLEQELEDKMENPITVSHDPRGVTLEIDGELCFSSGSIDLEDEIKSLLKGVSHLMTVPNDKRAILIEGHTDNVPLTGKLKARYTNNRTLSSIRASQVVNYLVDFLEVNENRLVAEGYADQWPAKVTWSEWRNRNVNIDKYNSTENEKKKNRRIKIIFTTQ